MTTQRANALTPSMVRRRMSWKDICAQYPNEWVVMVAMEWENNDKYDGALLSAVVIGHSKKRGESLRETRPIREREAVIEFAQWFTGEIVTRPFLSLSLL